MTPADSLPYLLTAGLVALHLTAAMLAFRAIRSARTPQGAVGWTVFLLALPYLGIPAYLFLGDFRYPGILRARKLSELAARVRGSACTAESPAAIEPRLRRLIRGFEAIAGRRSLSARNVCLLTDGQQAFDALFAAIDAAQDYILLETYILRDDRLGMALQQHLLDKAAAGVRICALYDPFGSRGIHRRYIERLRAGGIQIVNFHARHPSRRIVPRQLNFRNHRKVVVIDGRLAFTGGYNIGDEYLGHDPYFGYWRDSMVRLEGSVVSQLQLHFAEDWHWATGDIPELIWQTPAAAKDDMPALILASGPTEPHEPGTLYFHHAITAARSRIWIATPYFAPDASLLQALRLAALRGVDVRILMADKRDHWLVWLSAFAFMEEMRGSGVRFYRYQRGFMHQKVLLVDDMMASVGSHNLDSRSCRLNFEASALLFDQAFTQQVAQTLEQDFAGAEIYDRPLSDAPLVLRLAAPVARLFAPIL